MSAGAVFLVPMLGLELHMERDGERVYAWVNVVGRKTTLRVLDATLDSGDDYTEARATPPSNGDAKGRWT